MTRLILCLLLLVLGAGHVRANPPVPQSKAQALQDVQRDLDQEKGRQQELNARLKSIQKELEQTQAQLVQLADSIQGNEKNLASLEDRMKTLAAEQQELTDRLEQEYGSMAELVLALERMRRIPPESLIVRPGAPLQTAQTAMLLKSTLPAVQARAERVSKDLQRLNEINDSLERDKVEAIAARDDLLKKQESMQALVTKRQKLYRSTEGDLDKHKQRVAQLSREAQSLQDLISRLEREEKQRKSVEAAKPAGKVYGASIPASGAPRLPVAGTLVESFGKTNAIGATSQGLTIEARPGALVVAPMGGVVRFAGPFKKYGNMVIIEHQDGYHSLITGLDKVTTAEDSRLKPGEPVGQLGQSSFRGGPPTLYYELRFKGQPVNPATKISELKS